MKVRNASFYPMVSPKPRGRTEIGRGGSLGQAGACTPWRPHVASPFHSQLLTCCLGSRVFRLIRDLPFVPSTKFSHIQFARVATPLSLAPPPATDLWEGSLKSALGNVPHPTS